VFTCSEDCNEILLTKVFPRTDYGQYKRALCLLDPYNINLKWEVIEAAGKAKSIEIFVNFMIMDINRNALRRNPDKLIKSKVEQMTRLWGDDSWLDAGYDQVQTLSTAFWSRCPMIALRRRSARDWRRRPALSLCRCRCRKGMDIVSDIFDTYPTKQGL
jgi:three-Cys-motif partner protein